jgi:hypothetical protein
VADRGGLENRCGACRHRGFESHPLRLIYINTPLTEGAARPSPPYLYKFPLTEGAARPSPLSVKSCEPASFRSVEKPIIKDGILRPGIVFTPEIAQCLLGDLITNITAQKNNK